ncbi:hypothetical protein GCM10025865_18740 [Paraoerskovia sediminicola]|uniref:Uncharacterized protein n=1 Tax=Paraoerskovia sediminicola TaxID=1138587 RepID=A0ABM8G381_9CELL|nr:hypothetical protein [Paraoerskovia sediminicola]BDZ42575.1 hypothetical protein GCM10025865_18740 [Paraoerskovia sediminicola]
MATLRELGARLAEDLQNRTGRSVAIEAIRRGVVVMQMHEHLHPITIVAGFVRDGGSLHVSGLSITGGGYADHVKGESPAERAAYVDAWIRASDRGLIAVRESPELGPPCLPTGVLETIRQNTTFDIDASGRVLMGNVKSGLRACSSGGTTYVVGDGVWFEVVGKESKVFASSMMGLLDSLLPGSDD